MDRSGVDAIPVSDGRSGADTINPADASTHRQQTGLNLGTRRCYCNNERPAWGAHISIPRAISDSLPLGEEDHMWIDDDTTWNRTAQRHKLSSDVMHLSSLGESHHGEKKKM